MPLPSLEKRAQRDSPHNIVVDRSVQVPFFTPTPHRKQAKQTACCSSAKFTPYFGNSMLKKGQRLSCGSLCPSSPSLSARVVTMRKSCVYRCWRNNRNPSTGLGSQVERSRVPHILFLPSPVTVWSHPSAPSKFPLTRINTDAYCLTFLLR